MKSKEIPAVSAAIVSRGRFLLVRRGRPPAMGLYAFPGGRIETGETPEDAIRRELVEETGLLPAALRRYREVLIPAGREGPAIRITVFHGQLAAGDPVAGDDAAEAAWFGPDEIRRLPMTESTLAIVEELCAAGLS